MFEATEEEKTHIRKAEKRIQDIGVDDTESTMNDSEDNLGSVVPNGKGISPVDLNDVSNNRCVRKFVEDNDSDDSDSESESDSEEDEEPVNYQTARTCVQQKKSNNNKMKQTARQRITDFLGADSLHLSRDRLASPKQEKRRSLIASQKNTSSSSSSPE
jgi:hypothetical protein